MRGTQRVCLLCCIWMATPADLNVEQDGYIKHVCLLVKCVGHSVSVCCVVYGWQLQQTSM